MLALVWHLLLALVLVLRIVVSEYEPSTWNGTCPKPCSCYMRRYEVLHQFFFNTVNCSFQNLKKIPSGLSQKTEELFIVGNYIRNIYDYVPNLLKLKELDASRNQIRSLERGSVFLKLSYLSYLNLAKNELTSVVRNLFFGLINLKILILSNNKLTFIEDQAFHSLTSLLILDLSHNQLTLLYPEWFHGLVHLSELYVYENHVHSIGSATFKPLSHLKHLSLHGNRINYVSKDGFWGLDSIDTLHLERNYLQKIPISALQYLSSLKYLYMSGNPFKRIQEGDVSDLPIQELVLNNLPSLVLVDAFGFRNLNQLQSLQMRDCSKLAYIDAHAFVNLSSLHSLILQNDHLLTIPREIFTELPLGIRIELKGNPLQCDCNIGWIQKEIILSQKNVSRVNFVNGEDVTCAVSENMQGISVFYVDAISTLPTNCPPSILPTMKNVIEKLVGEPLILDCRSMGIPTPHMHWILPGGVILDGKNLQNKVRFQVKHSGTIEIYHLKEEDQGYYMCISENTLGKASVNVSIVVKPIDIHLYPTVISSTFITVIWNGSARRDFSKIRILYRVMSKLPSTIVHNNSGNDNLGYQEITARASRFDYTISNLIPESMYEFCIAYEDTGVYYILLSCALAKTRNADYMLQGISSFGNMNVMFLAIVLILIVIICFSISILQKCQQRQYVCPGEHGAYNASHIPLKNLYSPLMSNAVP